MAGLLADIANGANRLFGGTGGETPQPGIAQLDPGTQGMINDTVARSQQDASYFGNQANAGVAENSAGVGQNGQQAMQADQALGNDTGMYGAIRSAYNAQAGKAIGQLKQSNMMQGQFAKADYMARASRLMMAQQQVATQNNAMLVDAYNQAEMARAGLISSLFQLGGTAVAIGAANRRGHKPQPEMNTGMPEASAAMNSFHMPEMGSAGAGRAGGYGVGGGDFNLGE